MKLSNDMLKRIANEDMDYQRDFTDIANRYFAQAGIFGYENNKILIDVDNMDLATIAMVETSLFYDYFYYYCIISEFGKCDQSSIDTYFNSLALSAEFMGSLEGALSNSSNLKNRCKDYEKCSLFDEDFGYFKNEKNTIIEDLVNAFVSFVIKGTRDKCPLTLNDILDCNDRPNNMQIWNNCYNELVYFLNKTYSNIIDDAINYLYDKLEQDKSSLSPNETSYLVNKFISTSNKTDVVSDGEYRVDFAVDSRGFNGVLICDEKSKSIRCFVVRKKRGTSITLKLEKGISIYSINCCVTKTKDVSVNMVSTENEVLHNTLSLDERLEKLERIAKLHEAGVISEDELERLKKDLWEDSQMNSPFEKTTELETEKEPSASEDIQTLEQDRDEEQNDQENQQVQELDIDEEEYELEVLQTSELDIGEERSELEELQSSVPMESNNSNDQEEYYFETQEEFLAYVGKGLNNDKDVIWAKGDKYSNEFINGYQLFENGEYSRALLAFKKALTYNPIGISARFELVQTYLALKDYVSAQNELLEISEFLVYFSDKTIIAKFYRNFGHIKTEMGEYLIAFACYKHSFEFEKNDIVYTELIYITSKTELVLENSNWEAILEKNNIPLIKKLS